MVGDTYTFSGLATLDGVNFSLDLARSSGESTECLVPPVLVSVHCAHAAGRVHVDAVLKYVVDGVRSWLAHHKDQVALGIWGPYTVLGGIEVLLASLWRQELHHGEVLTGCWRMDGLNPPAPD